MTAATVPVLDSPGAHGVHQPGQPSPSARARRQRIGGGDVSEQAADRRLAVTDRDGLGRALVALPSGSPKNRRDAVSAIAGCLAPGGDPFRRNRRSRVHRGE